MSQFVILFAVIQEARPLLRRLRRSGRTLATIDHPNFPLLISGWSFAGGQVWVSGMGQTHAGNTMEGLLCTPQDTVLTCGFAGGLNPQLATGDILFHADPELFELVNRLRAAGAHPAHFSCEPQVEVSRQAKLDLHARTGCDAVEMESGVIRNICRRRGIHSATVRVISDSANENLPLDFNALMTPDMRLDGGRLALRLVCAPWKIPELMRFQKRVKASAERLAEVLMAVLECQENPSSRPP